METINFCYIAVKNRNNKGWNLYLSSSDPVSHFQDLDTEQEYRLVSQFSVNNQLATETNGMEPVCPDKIFSDWTEYLNDWHYDHTFDCWLEPHVPSRNQESAPITTNAFNLNLSGIEAGWLYLDIHVSDSVIRVTGKEMYDPMVDITAFLHRIINREDARVVIREQKESISLEVRHRPDSLDQIQFTTKKYSSSLEIIQDAYVPREKLIHDLYRLIGGFYRHPDYIQEWKVYTDSNLENENLESLVRSFGHVFHEKNGKRLNAYTHFESMSDQDRKQIASTIDLYEKYNCMVYIDWSGIRGLDYLGDKIQPLEEWPQIAVGFPIPGQPPENEDSPPTPTDYRFITLNLWELIREELADLEVDGYNEPEVERMAVLFEALALAVACRRSLTDSS